MRSGRLDIRVALLRKTTTFGGTGEPVETWTTLASRWAIIEPLQGEERNASEQWVAREQDKFTVRYSSDIANLSPLDQLVMPADDAALSPLPSRSVYDIFAVAEIGRHKELAISAARRVG